MWIKLGIRSKKHFQEHFFVILYIKTTCFISIGSKVWSYIFTGRKIQTKQIPSNKDTNYLWGYKKQYYIFKTYSFSPLFLDTVTKLLLSHKWTVRINYSVTKKNQNQNLEPDFLWSSKTNMSIDIFSNVVFSLSK